MPVLITKAIMNYLYVEIRLWKLGCQASESLKPLFFKPLSYLNNLKYCFYHKPPDFIITSSVTDCVSRNQSKYKLNDMLKSKACLHGLLGK